MDKRTLITFASWEPRFLLGAKRLIERKTPIELPVGNVIIFYSKGLETWTCGTRKQASDLWEKNGVSVKQVEVSYEEPVKSWKKIRAEINGVCKNGARVIVDISTMPRNTIFTIFQLLEAYGHTVVSVYNQPDKYKLPLCEDPERPYLIFKMSGEFDVAKQGTVLIVTLGFNPERLSTLIRYYEPVLTLVGLQEGEQFENQLRTVKVYSEMFGAQSNVDCFDIDVYAEGRGYETLTEVVTEYKSGYNILMSSLGPKPSVVSMYRVYKAGNKDVGFCYVPMKTYNIKYSKGIGETLVDLL